jgi:hypothetical protein
MSYKAIEIILYYLTQLQRGTTVPSGNLGLQVAFANLTVAQ